MPLVAQVLSVPEQLLWPLYAAVKETPAHTLLAVLAALVLLGLSLVRILAPPYSKNLSGHLVIRCSQR